MTHLSSLIANMRARVTMALHRIATLAREVEDDWYANESLRLAMTGALTGGTPIAPSGSTPITWPHSHATLGHTKHRNENPDGSPLNGIGDSRRPR